MKTLHCDVQERAMQCVFQSNYTFVTQVLRFLRKKKVKTSFSVPEVSVLMEFIKTHDLELFRKLRPSLSPSMTRQKKVIQKAPDWFNINVL